NSLLGTGFFKTSFPTSPRLSKDRSSMILSLSSNVAPGRGASKVLLKGDLVVFSAPDETKTTDEKEVAMKEKTSEDVGDFKVTVTREKGFGTQGASFTIATDKPIVKSVTVKDADGKVIPTTTFGVHFFNKKWTSNFTLQRVAEKAKVSVTWYAKDEK